jgi:hypothetical protein
LHPPPQDSHKPAHGHRNRRDALTRGQVNHVPVTPGTEFDDGVIGSAPPGMSAANPTM